MPAKTTQREKEVVLITGTSSGFGLLTSIALAQKGYLVLATMRDLSRKAELLHRAEQEGVAEQIKLFALDVTDEEQIGEVVERVTQEYGRIDVLINNAGYAQGGYIEELPLDKWKEQFETNFFGAIRVTQAILPLMRQQKKGKIINISSISGLISFPSLAPYASSKFAVEAFSEALRLEMLPYGIYVTLIEPASFQTGIWQRGLQSVGVKQDTSVYQQEMEQLTRIIQSTGESAPDPDPVIRTITKVVQVPAPKLRYPVGKGILLTIWLKKLLPWSWIEKVILHQIHQKKR